MGKAKISRDTEGRGTQGWSEPAKIRALWFCCSASSLKTLSLLRVISCVNWRRLQLYEPKRAQKRLCNYLKYYRYVFGPRPLSDCASFAHQQLWNPSWQAGFMRRGRQPHASQTHPDFVTHVLTHGSHHVRAVWDLFILGTLNFSTRSSSTDLRHSAASLAAFATTSAKWSQHPFL